MKLKARSFSINTQIKILTGLALVFFLILCFLIYHNTSQLLVHNADNYSSLVSRRLETEFSLAADTANTVLQNLKIDESFSRLLAAPYSEKSTIVRHVVNTITNYSILNLQIKDISLVSDSLHFSKLYSYDKLDSFHRTLRTTNSGFLGIQKSDFYHLSNKGSEELLTMGALFYLDGKEAGAVIISMSSASITSQFQGESDIGSYYLLCDESGIIHPFNCPPEQAHKLYDAYRTRGESVSSFVTDGYNIRITGLGKMGCHLLSALDLEKTGEDLHDITLPIWVSVALPCIYSLCLFFLLSRNVVAPLNQFIQTIQHIRTSRSRSIPEPVVLRGCQELSVIGSEFTDMMQAIQGLNAQIFQTTSNLYEAKVQKQEAEISYLRSQVDPRFLYNTLELVRKMAIERDAPEISAITMDISTIFRYSAKGGTLVCLEDELKIMEAYIHIQQSRFRKKIDVIYHFPEDTLKLKVIKMLLQPLVENAIFHGLEPKNGIGTLFLGAKREGTLLTISIRDDGIGIPPDKLEAIKKELNSHVYDTSKHVGIINTHARIQLQYGKEYGLNIDSTQSDGTNITLTLPAVTEQK